MEGKQFTEREWGLIAEMETQGLCDEDIRFYIALERLRDKAYDEEWARRFPDVAKEDAPVEIPEFLQRFELTPAEWSQIENFGGRFLRFPERHFKTREEFEKCFTSKAEQIVRERDIPKANFSISIRIDLDHWNNYWKRIRQV